MKKIKGFYHNNRIFCILMIVSLFCIFIIGVVFILYFVNQTKSDKYGNRLNGIENIQISNDHKNEISSFITENEMVNECNIDVIGKIIYINIYMNNGKIDDAQNIAIKTLEKITEDEKSFYDINFTFIKDNTSKKENEDNSFQIMGYKKSDKTIISWTRVNGA